MLSLPSLLVRFLQHSSVTPTKVHPNTQFHALTNKLGGDKLRALFNPLGKDRYSKVKLKDTI